MSTPPSPLRIALPPLLRLALHHGLESQVRVFVQRGLNLHATDERGRDALILAAARGHLAVCRLLLEAGANPMHADQAGLTAIDHARLGSFPQIETLLLAAPSPLLVQGPRIAAKTPFEDDPQETPADSDLLAWEEELPPEPPPPNFVVKVETRQVQRSITRHVPTDADQSWADVDILLPEISARPSRSRPEDWERRAELRTLLQMALETGTVPRSRAESLCLDERGEIDEDHYCHLLLVLGDLGAEVDESLDWASDLPDLEMSEEATLLVDEAIDFLGNLDSDGRSDGWPRHD